MIRNSTGVIAFVGSQIVEQGTLEVFLFNELLSAQISDGDTVDFDYNDELPPGSRTAFNIEWALENNIGRVVEDETGVVAQINAIILAIDPLYQIRTAKIYNDDTDVVKALRDLFLVVNAVGAPQDLQSVLDTGALSVQTVANVINTVEFTPNDFQKVMYHEFTDEWEELKEAWNFATKTLSRSIYMEDPKSFGLKYAIHDLKPTEHFFEVNTASGQNTFSMNQGGYQLKDGVSLRGIIQHADYSDNATEDTLITKKFVDRSLPVYVEKYGAIFQNIFDNTWETVVVADAPPNSIIEIQVTNTSAGPRQGGVRQTGSILERMGATNSDSYIATVRTNNNSEIQIKSTVAADIEYRLYGVTTQGGIGL